MLRKIAVIFLFVLGSTFPAFAAYEHCTQILADGVMKSYSYYSSDREKKIMKDWLCYSVNESSTRNFEAEANIFFKTFGLDAGEKNSTVDSWAEQYCYDSSSDYDATAITTILMEEADEKIVDAWTACVTAEPSALACYVQENNDDNIMVTVRTSYRVRILDIKSTNLVQQGRTPRYIEGSYTFLFDKVDAEKDALFTINGKLAGDNVECNEGVSPADSDFGAIDQPSVEPVEFWHWHMYWGEKDADNLFRAGNDLNSDNILRSLGYTKYLPIGRIYPPDQPVFGTIPLYSWYNGPFNGDWFVDEAYTTDDPLTYSFKSDSIFEAFGYEVKNIVGYIYPPDRQVPGTVGLYSWMNPVFDSDGTKTWNDGVVDDMLTTDNSPETINYLNSLGFQRLNNGKNGLIGFIFPN